MVVEAKIINGSNSSYGAAKEIREGSGVIVDSRSVRRVRSGERSGTGILTRVDASEMLIGNLSVVIKDDFLAKLANEGVSIRRVGDRRGSYTSYHFIDQLADVLDTDHSTIDSYIRLMRAEISFAESDKDSSVPVNSQQQLAKYIADYSSSGKPSKAITELGRNWSGDSIAEFYKLFYKFVTQPSVARTLPPYEVSIFESFYTNRLQQGSRQSRLDRLTLDQLRTDISLKSHLEIVRRTTGVKYDERSFETQSALLLGRKLGMK